VYVGVYQSRGHVQAAHVGHRAGLCRIDPGPDRCDLAVGDRHVHHRIDIVAGVDDVASLEQDLVARLRVSRDRENEEERGRESEECVQHAFIVVEGRQRCPSQFVCRVRSCMLAAC
jgi:hypothetical protein